MIKSIVEKLLLLLPKANEDLLELLTEQCMDEFRHTCNRDDVPETAASVIRQMVLWHYNQRGAEGLLSQNYSGMSESYAAEYPAPLRKSIHSFRRLRTL